MNEAARGQVLLVDDEVDLLTSVADRLRRDGFEVATARSGREALERLDAAWPDLVILDLMMPGLDGVQLAARIKKRADIPIVVLSAITAAESKIELIERYAEDYLTKPFEYDELRARVERVLRRLADRLPRRELALGEDLTLVLPRREAVVRGQSVSLTPTETRFLASLAAHLGRPVTTERLLSTVWSAADSADPPYVWVTVRRLRLKLERDPDEPRYLLTERGLGYRLVAHT
ncbi:MAG TPA: response regulator transcription factor [Candidatus Limnocylindrales bacterium]|nr:response regulator transcription factor [Candidatus Limnocylindrales bacterium]